MRKQDEALFLISKYLDEEDWNNDDSETAELTSLLTMSGELKAREKKFTSSLLDFRRSLRMLISLTGKSSERVLDIQLKICSVLIQQKRHIPCMDMLVSSIKCRTLTSDESALVLAYASTCLLEAEYQHKAISVEERDEMLLGNRHPLEGFNGCSEQREAMRIISEIETAATSLVVALFEISDSEAETLAANHPSVMKLSVLNELKRNV